MLAILEEKSMPIPECGCCIWLGGVSDERYGTIFLNDKQERAHRVSFADANDVELSSTDFVCHKCDVTLCIEPNHLFLGNAQSNMDDKVAKGRQSRLHGFVNGSAKLTNVEVALIEKSNLSRKALASMYGVSVTQIRRIQIGFRSGRTGR